jgi:hypothetical protein
VLSISNFGKILDRGRGSEKRDKKKERKYLGGRCGDKQPKKLDFGFIFLFACHSIPRTTAVS